VELFLVLIRNNEPQANEVLSRLGIIPTILDLFFTYHWNNMLHGLVESIIRCVLDMDSGLLKTAIFHQGRFFDRVFAAFKFNDLECAKKKNGHRLGYMGHLIRTCNAIALISQRDPSLATYYGGPAKIKAWDAFIYGTLAKENEVQQTILGGTQASPYQEASDDDEAGDGQDPYFGQEDEEDPVLGGVYDNYTDPQKQGSAQQQAKPRQSGYQDTEVTVEFNPPSAYTSFETPLPDDDDDSGEDSGDEKYDVK